MGLGSLNRRNTAPPHIGGGLKSRKKIDENQNNFTRRNLSLTATSKTSKRGKLANDEVQIDVTKCQINHAYLPEGVEVKNENNFQKNPETRPTDHRTIILGLIGTNDEKDGGHVNESPNPPNPLNPRRWFGGLIDDIEKRYPLFKSDFLDGLNLQCLAAIIFNAFAQISGCVAFGGLMGAKTENYIGISETLLASGIGGLIYSFLAGQPMLIVGTTGPLLLFDASLYSFCKSNDIDFLAIRTWTGLWLSGMALIFTAFQGSILIKFFTRFTQEVFAALISLLFLAESVLSLVNIYKAHPLVSTYGICEHDPMDLNKSKIVPGSLNSNQPNTALLSTILMFMTFVIAWSLRSFKTSKFLTKTIRNTVGNFAPPIAIISMVLLDYLIKETVTKKLDVPEGLRPTHDRNWLVNPGSVEAWVAGAAIIPGFLLFVLVFMEVAISELIVSKKENKLVKGSGLHLDVLLVSLVNTGQCFFGLPWASVAIVRSVAHCASLTVWSTPQPGSRPAILKVKEQRLTNVIISILTTASVAMTPILVLIPLAVIFGIFFFMGVASISGIQFFDRVFLFFKLPINHPQVPYVQQVRTRKMHIFTAIQLAWLALLWGIKYTPAALSFPFILIILIPFRFFVLPFLFSTDELDALDSSGEKKTCVQIPMNNPENDKK